MRDHKLSIEPGEELHRECELRSWFVRAVSTDDVVELITDDCRLLLFAGQTVDRDDVVDGFRLINRGDAAVTLHLQTASRASIGEKKNGDAGSGVDQTARDAAAAVAADLAALTSRVDALEGGGAGDNEITTPAPNSTITGGSATFEWNTVTGARYWLYVGTSAGGLQIHDSADLGPVSSHSVTGLPTDGSTIYVTLWTKPSGGSWAKTHEPTYTTGP